MPAFSGRVSTLVSASFKFNFYYRNSNVRWNELSRQERRFVQKEENLDRKIDSLEKKEEVIARIKEASQYVPLENLYLSTQCGFASTEEGNKLTEKQQWNKIRLMLKIAHSVWKNK